MDSFDQTYNHPAYNSLYCKDTEPWYHSFISSLVSNFFQYLSITCNAFIACYQVGVWSRGSGYKPPSFKGLNIWMLIVRAKYVLGPISQLFRPLDPHCRSYAHAGNSNPYRSVSPVTFLFGNMYRDGWKSGLINVNTV